MDYRKPFDAPDNETAARDCETVCVCNVKPDPWAACDCRACLADDEPGSLAWLDQHAGQVTS